MKKMLVLDTETTGLPENHLRALHLQPHVIEVHLCSIIDGEQIKEEFTSLVNPGPGVKLTPKITKITGLKDEDLITAPPFKTIAAPLREKIEAAPCIVAHNASFDQEMLNFEYERIGQPIKWPRLICTIEQTIHLKGYRLNLQALHELLFGESFDKAHRAKADTQALARCVVELNKRGLI